MKNIVKSKHKPKITDKGTHVILIANYRGYIAQYDSDIEKLQSAC